jgi:beclin
VAANLFDIVSGNSKINHPLCDECTDVLMDMMEEELQQAEADYTDYSNYLKELVLSFCYLDQWFYNGFGLTMFIA